MTNYELALLPLGAALFLLWILFVDEATLAEPNWRRMASLLTVGIVVSIAAGLLLEKILP